MRVALRQLAYNSLTSEVPARHVRAVSGPGSPRKEHLHQGADFGGVQGEPVLAIMAGIVRGVWAQLEDGTRVEVSPAPGQMTLARRLKLKAPFGFGLWVDVEHAPLGVDLPQVGDVPLRSRAHPLSAAFVRKGQEVSAGELLGAMGASGVGSGAVHEHLGISGGDWCFDPRGFQLWTTATELAAGDQGGKKLPTNRPSWEYGPNVRKLWPLTHVVVTPCFPVSGTATGKQGVDGLAPAVLADGTPVSAIGTGRPVYASILKGPPPRALAGAFGAPPRPPRPPRPRHHHRRGGGRSSWGRGWDPGVLFIHDEQLPCTCPTEWAPVRATDGRIYDSECLARCAGVAIVSRLDPRTTPRPTSSPFGAAFGDIVCVEGDCKLGESLITQMHAFFISATAPGMPKQAEMKAQFGPAVAAILAAAKEKQTWARKWLPFHPACCAIRDIAKQAQELTGKMAAAVGASSPVTVPVPWVNDDAASGAQSLISTAATIAVVVAGVWAGSKVLEAYKSSPRPQPRRLKAAG